VLAKARAAPELTGVFSNYEVSVPQISADVNRVKAKEHGISLTDVFETLQVYLGSIYVNDFNRFGRTYQVIAQADYPYRAKAEDILRLKTRNEAGEMVPLGSVVQVSQSYGPDRVFRYNGYLTADVNGGPAAGYSSGQAQAAMERILAETLPNGVKAEWTDLTYQEFIAGNSSVFVFPLCVLLVVLVLAALYESWTLPLAIVAIVPMALLSAIVGLWLTGGDNNIFTQIALFVLVGLASKNAILIVEFAKDREKTGVDPVACGAGSGATAIAADSDDVDRLHHGRRAAGVFVGGRCGDAPRHRYRRVLRNDRRDVLRSVPDTTLLRVAARRGAQEPPRPARGHRECGRCKSCVINSWRWSRPCCSLRARSDRTITAPKSRRPISSSAPTRRSSRRRTWSASSGSSSTTSSSMSLIERALVANHDIRIATSRLREARALRGQAKLDLAPTVTASSGYTKARASDRQLGPLQNVDREQDFYDSGFDAFWELDFFGRVRRGVEASTAQLQSAEASVYATQVSVTAEVARNYFELRGAQEQLEVARRNAENQGETVRITTARLDAGRGTQLDASRAQAQLSATLATIPDLEAGVTRSMLRLGVLTGQQPESVVPQLSAAKPLPTLPVAHDIGTPELLLRRRPDIRVAERNLAGIDSGDRCCRRRSVPAHHVPRSLGLRRREQQRARQYRQRDVLVRTEHQLGRVRPWPRASEDRAA
jgi:hypothetical protein